MAVSRFDRPIESLAMSTYVPIDFDMLYKLGKEQGDAVLRDREWFESSLDKFSKFRSLSAKDTETYYNETINRKDIQQKIQEAVSNPDVMKDASWVAGLRSSMANTDYLLLADLQTSADNFLRHQAYLLKLALEDKYNPLWHDVNYTDWDSRNNNVFTDVSPLPYKSEIDLVHPYTGVLKPEFIEQIGSYDWRGITTDRTDRAVHENFSAIYNSPYAQKHIEVLLKLGMSRQDAEKLFVESVYEAGRRYAYKDRQLNPLSQIYEAAEAKRKAAQKGIEDAFNTMRLTESISLSGMEQYKRGILNWNNEKYRSELESIDAELKLAEQSGDRIAANLLKKQKLKIYDTASKLLPLDMFKEIFQKHSTDKGLTNGGMLAATNEILSTFGYPIKNAAINDLLQSTIGGVSLNLLDTPLGKRRTIANGKDLDIAAYVFKDIAGLESSPKYVKKLNNALKNGDLTNLIVMSAQHAITLPLRTGNGISPSTSQIITVAIPESKISQIGMTPAELYAAGCRPISSSDYVASYSQEYRKNDQVVPPYDLYDADSGQTNLYNTDGKRSYRGPSETYWQIEMLNKIPDPTDQVNAYALDQQAWKLFMTDAARTGLFPMTQMEAYGVSANETEE